VVSLIPGLEVDPALLIPSGFDQTQDVFYKIDPFFQIQHTQHHMPRT